MKRLVVFMVAFLTLLTVQATVYDQVFAEPCRIERGDCPPGQPHGDVFEAPGFDLQALNPTNQAALRNETIRYRLSVIPGCNQGNIVDDLAVMTADLRRASNGKINLERNDQSYHFTVYVSCGNTQVRKCGSVNILCLPDGFPYNTDVYISDVMWVPGATWPQVTRVSILCHEICGHAIMTWMEQYCLGTETSGPCLGLARFASTPGWVDIMNTGPDSRHYLGAVEIARIERTMFPLSTCSPLGFDECTGRWIMPDGFSYDPITKVWYNPQGTPEWAPCDAFGNRYSLYLKAKTGRDVFVPQRQGFYDLERRYWSFAPGC